MNSGKANVIFRKPISGMDKIDVERRADELVGRGWKKLTEVKRETQGGIETFPPKFICLLESPSRGGN